MYWWEDFALSSYILSDIEVGVRTPEMVPVPRANFRNFILYDVFKKHPHLLANHLWVRTHVGTWSRVKEAQPQEGRWAPRGGSQRPSAGVWQAICSA